MQEDLAHYKYDSSCDSRLVIRLGRRLAATICIYINAPEHLMQSYRLHTLVSMLNENTHDCTSNLPSSRLPLVAILTLLCSCSLRSERLFQSSLCFQPPVLPIMSVIMATAGYDHTIRLVLPPPAATTPEMLVLLTIE